MAASWRQLEMTSEEAHRVSWALSSEWRDPGYPIARPKGPTILIQGEEDEYLSRRAIQRPICLNPEVVGIDGGSLPDWQHPVVQDYSWSPDASARRQITTPGLIRIYRYERSVRETRLPDKHFTVRMFGTAVPEYRPVTGDWDAPKEPCMYGGFRRWRDEDFDVLDSFLQRFGRQLHYWMSIEDTVEVLEVVHGHEDMGHVRTMYIEWVDRPRHYYHLASQDVTETQ